MELDAFFGNTARRLAQLGCALLALAAGPALAQPPGEVEKALLRLQQYQDELQLRQRQFAEQHDPALSPAQRRTLEGRHLQQRQRQQELHDGQLRRHDALQQGLPPLPEHRQRAELLRESQEFARERAQQAEEFRRGTP